MNLVRDLGIWFMNPHFYFQTKRSISRHNWKLLWLFHDFLDTEPTHSYLSLTFVHHASHVSTTRFGRPTYGYYIFFKYLDVNL